MRDELTQKMLEVLSAVLDAHQIVVEDALKIGASLFAATICAAHTIENPSKHPLDFQAVVDELIIHGVRIIKTQGNNNVTLH